MGCVLTTRLWPNKLAISELHEICFSTNGCAPRALNPVESSELTMNTLMACSFWRKLAKGEILAYGDLHFCPLDIFLVFTCIFLHKRVE